MLYSFEISSMWRIWTYYPCQRCLLDQNGTVLLSTIVHHAIFSWPDLQSFYVPRQRTSRHNHISSSVGKAVKSDPSLSLP